MTVLRFPARSAAPRASTGLRRPRLLAAAAREGARRYLRSRDLPALLPEGGAAADAATIVGKLRGLEAECEGERRARAAGYSVVRHVAVLSALAAEVAAYAARRTKRAA